MKAMVRRRLASMLLAFLGVAVVTFVVIRILPGDIAMLVLGGDVGTIDPEILAATRERLGVADSIPSQFFRWISGIVTLDFGESFYTREPVIESIARTLPYTAEIALLATLMAVGISIPLGYFGRRSTKLLARSYCSVRHTCRPSFTVLLVRNYDATSPG